MFFLKIKSGYLKCMTKFVFIFIQLLQYRMTTNNDLARVHNRILPYIHRTPVLTSNLLNEISGAEIFFKCENFQRMGAFKMRGAANAVLNLPEENVKREWLLILRGTLPRRSPLPQKVPVYRLIL